jgi:uncharacterized membrane protein (UPF0182 family)
MAKMAKIYIAAILLMGTLIGLVSSPAAAAVRIEGQVFHGPSPVHATRVSASYTDIHVELPILWLLIGLSIVAAFAAWANLRVHTYRLPAAAAVLVFGGSFLLSGVVPVDQGAVGFAASINL